MTARTDRRPGPAPERSVRLAAWGTAFLSARASLDETTLRIVGADEQHSVAGLPGETAPTSWTLAFGRLRAAGVTGLRLVLVAPGDPAGLPGPASLTSAVMAAGEGVLTYGGPPLGLVPVHAMRGVTWEVHAAEGRPVGEPTLSEAERMLTETLAATTQELLRLDCAGFGPEIADALSEMRADEKAGCGTLPPGHPPRAARVLTMAERVTAIADLASASNGGATSATAADTRAALLRELARAARRARVAAYNAVLEPSR
ncbi:MAG: hypothetical protein QOG53_2061 [Frankiales bacterium]|jgi:hypothetical protein|nr:hypothetical protein [Frankiales bacterium]